MDIIFCATESKHYDIASFSQLDKHTLSNLRKALFCPECKRKGYYQKASKDGKSACFGAYHEDNCEYKTQNSAPRILPEAVEEVRTIATNNQIVDVDFTLHKPNDATQSPSKATLGLEPKFSTNSKKHTQPSAQTRNAQRGLKRLLKMLMHTDTFASSNIEINTGAKHPFKAKNLFVNFDEANEKHINKWHGHWGMIGHACSDMSWLNVANERDISIPIDSSIKGEILKTFKIKCAEDLAGASILVFGKLTVSPNSKWYIKIDSTRIFIKPPLTNSQS